MLLARSPNVVIERVPSKGHYIFAMHCNTAPFDNNDLRMALDEVKRRGGARIMSIGDLNPTRSAGAPDAIANFVAALAAALAAD